MGLLNGKIVSLGLDKKSLFILLGVAILSILHYVTPVDKPLLHDLYRRLYYLPIIYAAFSFGLRGAVFTSLLVSLVFLPHVFHRWGYIHLQTYDALFEILLYNIVAFVSGSLVEAERKRRRELEKTQQELFQANKFKVLGELAGGMAHEIRNPLGSIQGSLEILRKDYKPEDPKYEFLNILLKETQRLNQVVSDFLNYIRPGKPVWLDCDINQIIEETVLMMNPQASKKGIKIKTELKKDLPHIQGDPSQIKQAFLNLILNSIESVENQGKISITDGEEEDYLWVKFSDTGKGIKPEDLEKIFVPFYTTKKEGSGLGLGIVERIVDLHKGKIFVESRENKGTTFTLKFPKER
jgi:signal transduction histidine kinase